MLLLISDRAVAQIPGFSSTPISFPGQAASEAVDPQGNVWIADPSHEALGRLELPSQNYTSYPIPASENARLYNIATTPDGAIWYTDYNNPIIGRRTPDGNISQFSVPAKPFLIAGSSDNGVFFSDLGGGTSIRYMTLAGGILKIASLPIPAGTFVQNLTVGPDGAAYFTDFSNHRIGRVDLGGHVTFFAATKPNPPSSLAYYPSITTGPDGNIWFTHATFIGRARLSDGLVTEYPIPYANADAGGICTGGDGNIWFADSYAGAGVVSQLVVSTATDDGHATINASPGIGQPIGIIAVTPLSIATLGKSRDPKSGTACPTIALAVEQNYSSGANLDYITILPGGKPCADLRFLPTQIVNDFSTGGKLILQFQIFNAGPNDADPPELQIANVQGVSNINVTDLVSWGPCQGSPTFVGCFRESPLKAGEHDTGSIVIDSNVVGNTFDPIVEIDAFVFSATADPVIFNNFFNFSFTNFYGRKYVSLNGIRTNSLRSVINRE